MPPTFPGCGLPGHPGQRLRLRWGSASAPCIRQYMPFQKYPFKSALQTTDSRWPLGGGLSFHQWDVRVSRTFARYVLANGLDLRYMMAGNRTSCFYGVAGSVSSMIIPLDFLVALQRPIDFTRSPWHLTDALGSFEGLCFHVSNCRLLQLRIRFICHRDHVLQ